MIRCLLPAVLRRACSPARFASIRNPDERQQEEARVRVTTRERARSGGTMWVAIVIALLALTLASPVQAQTFSTADLEGTWEVFQLATPMAGVTGDGIRTYRGEVTFDATGL